MDLAHGGNWLTIADLEIDFSNTSLMKISEQQSTHNANTRSKWDYFATHRQQTTKHICEASHHVSGSQTKPTLAVLGAGNGNDLELKTIVQSFSKIHLFDFDPVALEHLKSQQLTDPEISNSVVIEPPVDLSGVVSELESIPSTITEPSVVELGNKTRAVENVLPGRQFDVVASVCLTSQLMDTVVRSMGNDSPFKNYMMIAIRDGHLQLMEKLIRPGGAGVLVFDFVSSDTLPELVTAETEEAVLETARKAIDQRNFFTGANPWSVKDALGKLIVESSDQPWTIAPPWRWRIGERRFYGVSCLGFSKPV